MTTPKNETLATLRITTTDDTSSSLLLRTIIGRLVGFGASAEIAHDIAINGPGIPATVSDLDHDGQHPYWPLNYHQAVHHCDEDGFVTAILTISQEKWREAIEAWALGYEESETDLCHDMVFSFGEPADATATIIGVRETIDNARPYLVVMYTTLIADPHTVTDPTATTDPEEEEA